MTRAVFDLIRSQSCIVCGEKTVDACHIRSQKAGGLHEEWNLYPGCRLHHSHQHNVGIVTFFKKFPSVRKYFESKGWVLSELFGQERLWHPNLAIKKKDSCL